MWIILSVFGAFSQAVGMAVKKKALQIRGLNNFIAFFSFTLSGVLIALILLFTRGGFFPEIDDIGRFWNAAFWMVFLNIFAYYFLYKALDIADLSYLMPYMTLISITVIIPPIFLIGEIPTTTGLLGIFIVVAGAFLMEYKGKKKLATMTEEERQKRKNNKKGFIYFIITALCWTFTSSFLKIASIESNAVFSSFIISVFMGLSFGLIVIFTGELKRVKELFIGFGHKEKIILFTALVIAGVAITLEQITINEAFRIASVGYVIAVKRTMPFFAFLVGYFYFKEKTNMSRKVIATALMIAGSLVIAVFG